jgi:signal transduction histidine kinase
MKRPSLVGRLIRWQVMMMGVCWLLLVGWLFHTMTDFENGDLDRRMKYFAEILAETASGAGADRDALAQRMRATEKIFVEGVIETLENAAGYRATVQVFDRDGALLYRSGDTPALPLAAATGLSEGTRDDGSRWRFARVQSSDRSVTVIVGESEAGRWLSIWPMLQIIGASQVLILAASLAVTWFAARRGVRPLQALADGIARREPGDPSPINAPLIYAETMPVVRELNAMFERESRRLESERGFLADAAHELRTPLAAIGTQAHLVVAATEDAERARHAQALRAGLDRVSHLLAQLLTIARVEAPGACWSVESVDVAGLVRDCLAELSSTARARAISLALDCPETLHAEINRAGFTSVVQNLVDNAIRYTPGGGHVVASLALRGDGLEFAVRDDGPGIAAEERERVFERFYRISGPVAEGSGLGLAIVRGIAQAHRATLKFVDGLSGAGIGVVFHLPLAVARSSDEVGANG